MDPELTNIPRWEIKDKANPKDRGMRFSSLVRARKELAQAVPAGRFVILDRVTKQTIEE